MTEDLIESLLRQNESESLDFKLCQYPFEGATEIQKGELLKDLLAFTNAWRETDAHILIGVEEVKGGRSIVRGEEHHLLNRNLQQFANSKVNRPFSFSYAEAEIDGLPIGVLTIPVQDRPVFLLKDYGRLKGNVVYIRRGDTTGEASPDEVLKFGGSATRRSSQPVLDLSFSDAKTRQDFGTELDVACTSYRIVSASRIPSYGDELNGPFGIVSARAMTTNEDFFRDIAEYVLAFGVMKPVGFAILNSSTTAAINVKLRFRVPTSTAELKTLRHMPDEPSPDRYAALRPTFAKTPNEVQVSDYGDFSEARFSLGTIQPGMLEWTADQVYIGSREAFSLPIEVTISADNLLSPLVKSLQIRSTVTEETLTLSQLRSMARELDPEGR